ncbi:MAG: hypothetical protein K2L02_00630 [Clostridia bacterium]|nr:hypothetical protein [Clostridia bacterium]
MTLYHDLTSYEEVESVLFMLADSVSARMREGGLPRARTVKLWVRESDLSDLTRQGGIEPTSSGVEIGKRAMQLFKEFYDWKNPVRALGVSVCNFSYGAEQISIFDSTGKKEKLSRLESTIDSLRGKYGNGVLRPAVILQDKRLSDLDIKDDHLTHHDPLDK